MDLILDVLTRVYVDKRSPFKRRLIIRQTNKKKASKRNASYQVFAEKGGKKKFQRDGFFCDASLAKVSFFTLLAHHNIRSILWRKSSDKSFSAQCTRVNSSRRFLFGKKFLDKLGYKFYWYYWYVWIFFSLCVVHFCAV